MPISRISKVVDSSSVQQEIFFQSAIRTSKELVKNMIISLIATRFYYSRFFQQIPVDECACYLPRSCKLDANKLAEPRRVVVADGLGIPECLQDGISSKDLLRKIRQLARPRSWTGCIRCCNRSKILNDLFGVLCLSRS